jgi:hypothetical protein
MTTLGMPTPMFLVFVATILAGSLGAIHYVIVHILLGRPFPDEEDPITARDPGERTTDSERPRTGAKKKRGGQGAGESDHV